MLFNSIEFGFFFVIVTLLYFLLPYKWRWMMLLGASCYFYMAFIPVYITILALTIVVDYYAGIVIERSSGRKKKAMLVLSVVVTCLILAFFKYLNFFNDNLRMLADWAGYAYPEGQIDIVLPIGLSFHTFQSLSYVIEVYRGKQKAERHFGIYSLYVMFYPQLVAGPIERPQNLLDQFHTSHSFDYKNVTDGLKRIAWGLFKKVVIADRLAVMVDAVYANPYDFEGLTLLMATVYFSIQIYCDFSGYSDIALGTAQVMGFKLMENFKRPYHAQNVADFWKRWHISLSTWFKDYLYISMGGNRVSIPRWYFNLFFTFMVSGFWHGAQWTFVVWGALHGFYLIFALITEKPRNSMVKALGLKKLSWLYTLSQVLITFVLVAYAWIFFRAESLEHGLYIASHLVPSFEELSNWEVMRYGIYKNFNLPLPEVLIALLGILIMETVHWQQRKGSIREQLAQKPAWVRWTLYYGICIAIVFFGYYTQQVQFIYFQF